MAAYSVAENEVAANDKTLVANTVDTVTFLLDVEYFEVLTDGADVIWVTTDSSTPVAGGARCYKIPAVPCARTIRHSLSGGVVKLISPGTPKYSATRM